MNYEFKELIDSLDTERVIKLMQSLGVDRYEDKGNCIIFPTICHNEDPSAASDKLYFYKNNKFFYCYTECGGQSIFNFLKHYYETRGIEYNWYQDIFEVVKNCGTRHNVEGFTTGLYRERLSERYGGRQQIKLQTYPNGIVDIFTKFYPTEWLEDGISKEAMDKYNIRYSIGQQKIIIPHYNINGELVGIRGRALNEWEIENIGKYMPVKIEDKWYSHPLSLNLYGLNHNLANIKKNRKVYLFESEKAVLQFESFGEDNCAVGVCGSNFNKYQLNILLETCYPDEIIVCFDKEEKDGEDKYFYKLYNMCKKYSRYCNFSFIYDRYNLLNLKDSPSDRGYEIFKKLLEKKVRVK